MLIFEAKEAEREYRSRKQKGENIEKKRGKKPTRGREGDRRGCTP